MCERIYAGMNTHEELFQIMNDDQHTCRCFNGQTLPTECRRLSFWTFSLSGAHIYWGFCGPSGIIVHPLEPLTLRNLLNPWRTSGTLLDPLGLLWTIWGPCEPCKTLVDPLEVGSLKALLLIRTSTIDPALVPLEKQSHAIQSLCSKKADNDWLFVFEN